MSAFKTYADLCKKAFDVIGRQLERGNSTQGLQAVELLAQYGGALALGMSLGEKSETPGQPFDPSAVTS